MILRVYVDVSGKENQHRVITAAAYIANEAEVAAFEHRWKATLDFATLTQFHATEFFACKGKLFKHLLRGSDHHKKSAALFALTAYMSFQQGFGFSVDVEHYAPNLDHVLGNFHTPHDRLPASMLAIARIGNMAYRKGIIQGGHEAVMFIEEGDGVGEIIDFLLFLKRIGEPWAQAFRSFVPLPKSEYSLQAADYLAYEARLETQAVLWDPDRSWSNVARDTFKLITTGPEMLPPALGTSKVDLDYATAEHFAAWAPQFTAFLKANPQYRRAPWHRNWRRRSRRWFHAQLRALWGFASGKAKRFWFGTLRQGKRRKKRQ